MSHGVDKIQERRMERREYRVDIVQLLIVIDVFNIWKNLQSVNGLQSKTDFSRLQSTEKGGRIYIHTSP